MMVMMMWDDHGDYLFIYDDDDVGWW